MAIKYLSGITVDSTVLVVDSANDRVGIGTASPAYKLDVNGDINLPFGTSNGYRINGNRILSQGSGFFEFGALDYKSTYPNISTNSDGTFRIQSNGSTLVTVNQSGNVGIGTTSPAKKLVIAGASSELQLYSDSDISTIDSRALGNTSSKWLAINPSGGSVGIGTTTPVSPLDVNGIISSRGIYIAQNSGTYNLIYNASNIVAMYLGGSADPGNYYDNTTHYFRSAGGGTTYAIINNLGNVGIGTTSPGTKLVVVGGDDAAGVGVLEIQTAGGTNLKIGGNSTYSWIQSHSSKPLYINQLGNNVILNSGGGNVGIGTTSPAAKLTVSGTTYLNLTSDYFGASTTVQISSGGGSNAVGILSNTFYLYPYSSNTTTSLVYGYNGNASWGLTNAGGNSRFDFYSYAAGSSIMSITSSGNVGIGTTSPAVKFVVSNAGASGFEVDPTGGVGSGPVLQAYNRSTSAYMAQSYYALSHTFNVGSGGSTRAVDITSAGNVGIGTTSPARKLDIVSTNAQIRISDGTANTYWEIMSLFFQSNQDFIIQNQNNVGILINSSGNVGVGTQTPGAKIHVVGTESRFGGVASGFISVYNATGRSGYIQANGGTDLRIASDSDPMTMYVNGSERMRISSAGALKLNAYGSGSNTGTATQRLAVDASGNVIEIPIGSGPVDGNGTANYVTKWSDTDTITNSIIYDNGTNVGIGTTSPGYKLDVAGTSRSDLHIFRSNQSAPTADAFIFRPADNTIALGTANSERMRITSAGVVGIGTTSPSGLFEVKGDGVSYFTRGTKSILLNPNVVGQDTNALIDTSTGMALAFGTAGSERMRITSAGEVLIGTTTDSGNYKLQVNGRGLFQERLVINETANDTQLQILGNGTNIMSLQGRDAAGSGVSLIALNNDGGNVSIGTTAQLARTTILSDSSAQTIGLIGRSADNIATIRWWNNAGNTVYTAIESNANYTIYNTVTNGYAAFFTNNSERVRITSAGNVGIGTTSPSYKLDVSGGIRSSTIDLATQGVNVSSYGFLSQTLSGQMTFLGHNVRASNTVNNTALVVNGGWISSLIKQYYNEGITFHTSTTEYAAGATYPLADTERMRITSAGNVGIGTTSPIAKLHINSATNPLSSAIQGDSKLVISGVDGNMDLLSQDDNTTVANSIGLGRYNQSTGALIHKFGIVGWANTGSAGSNTGNRIAFHYGTSADAWSNSELMSITSGGNVGIGTTSPSTKLQVIGAGRVLNVSSSNDQVPASFNCSTGGVSTIGFYAVGSANDYNVRIGANVDAFVAYTNDTERLRITSAGNVGIGTTSPNGRLQVNQGTDLNVAINTVTNDSVTVSRISSLNDAATASAPLVINANRLVFTTDTLERMRITSGGNVGIGTDSPSQNLHVAGNIRVTGAYYDSNNEAGTGGQVLTSNGSGTDWVTPYTSVATSLYDLLPAARVAYNWTGQVVNDTWTTIFSKSDNILTTGTWMVKMYVNDFAVGGGHYQYVYSGIMTWEQGTVNQTGEAAFSEIYLHRMGHAANASVLYLRTAESGAAASNLGYFQIKGNYSNTSNQTIQFQFVKIF